MALFALVPICSANADLLVKSSNESKTGGNPGGKMHTVIKVKGPWTISQVEMAPVKLPGSQQAMPMPTMPATLVNGETREVFQMNDGKWVKRPIPSAAQMEMTEKAMAGNPMANAKFKPTGRKEKVREYDTEVWESVDDATKITVWVAPALKKFKDQVGKGSPGMTKESAEKMRIAWAVLPGYVVKSSIESDMAKQMAASMPPGSKMPEGMANMKSLTVSEVEEIKEVTFTESEFPLPEVVK